MTITRHIDSLYRYPVKGFSEEPLQRIHLSVGEGFPMDRALALTDGKWTYSKNSYVPKNKLEFIGLMGQPQIALIKLRADGPAERLHVVGHEGDLFEIDAVSGEGSERFIDYLIAYLKLDGATRPSLCRGDGGAFSDLAMLNRAGVHRGNTQFAISVINLASLRDLEGRMGCQLDPLRFRANIYYDSDSPWEEQDWFGKYVRIGSLLGKVVMSTPRCVIPSVNPKTGQRDANVVQSLLKHYRHKDLGFYIDVVEPGEIGQGDVIEIERIDTETHSLISVPLNGVDYPVFVREEGIRHAAGERDDR